MTEKEYRRMKADEAAALATIRTREALAAVEEARQLAPNAGSLQKAETLLQIVREQLNKFLK